jgi:hypothetical protein
VYELKEMFLSANLSAIPAIFAANAGLFAQIFGVELATAAS